MYPDVAVIGGGVVGATIAYGLARRNVRVWMIDGADRDLRAANANFGLIWLQGKGMNMPAYQMHTRDSVALWPDFSAELADLTGADVQYERNGGLQICLGEADFEHRRDTLLRLHNQLGGLAADWEMVDREALGKLLPRVGLGAEVSGASYGRSDGHVNPLRLLAALHAGLVRRGGEIRGGVQVESIQAHPRGGFELELSCGRMWAGRVVIAAGHGSKAIAEQVGIHLPVRPQRGQILVTERTEPFLPLPTSGLRQTREGTVMIGATHDEVGFDTSTTTDAAAALSAKAIRRIPTLGGLKLIRQWAGLRILTPDRHPIYSESKSHPGAFVAVCHSGVTLAAVHEARLAEAIASGGLPPSFDAFHQRRFDVPQAA